MRRGFVDIIIPCYNQGRFLPDSVGSALAQTYDNVSIIVVDDGSTEDVESVVKLFGDQVNYIRKQNQGLPAARNTGIKAGDGEFVLCLDADDIILPHMLEDQLKLFSKNPTVDAVYSKALLFRDGNMEHPIAEGTRPYRQWDDLREPLGLICVLCTHTVLMRRSLIEEVGLWPVQMTRKCVDWYLWIDLASRGKRFLYLPRVHALYRIHPGSSSASESRVVARESFLLFKALELSRKGAICNRRQLTFLALGIISIAGRWMALGKYKEFQVCINAVQSLRRVTDVSDLPIGQLLQNHEVGPSLIYLLLAKSLLDLDSPSLAGVTFLRCGDLCAFEREVLDKVYKQVFDEVCESMTRLAHVESHVSVALGVGCENSAIRKHSSESDVFFRELESTIPHHASFWSYVRTQFGRMYANKGKWHAAEHEYIEALKLNPKHFGPHLALGFIHIRQGRLQEGLSLIRRAFKIDPRSTQESLIREVNARTSQLVIPKILLKQR